MQLMTENRVVPQLRLEGFEENWKIINFNDIADKGVKWSITGGPFGSDLKSENYTQNGVRIIQLQNIGDGIFNDKNKIYTSESKADSLLACNIYAGEIIISKMGDPVARACIMPLNSKRYLMSSDGIRFVPDAKKYDKQFIFQSINLPIFRKQAIRLSTGSTRKRIGLSELKKISFTLPPLPEQQKIASFLSSVDEKLQQLTKKKDLLEEYKKGVMQQIFTQELRFKDDNGNNYPDWEEKKLGELCEFAKSGGTPKSTNKEYYNGNIPFLSISDMTKQGKYLNYATKSISEEGVSNSSSWIVPVNTIIYSMYASVGFVAINKIPIATSQAVINLGLNSNCNTEFIYYNLVEIKKIIHRFIETGTQGNLNAQTVKNLKIELPCLKEQDKIANFLSSLDSKIDLVSTQIENTNAFKKGILQQMFV